MEEHTSVSEHVVKMFGYVTCLNALDCKIPDELAIDRVLQSLPPSYKGFVMNYKMHGIAKTMSGLFVMLKTVEVAIKKEHTVLMINKTVDFKKSGATVRDTRDAHRPPRAYLCALPEETIRHATSLCLPT